MRWYKLAKSYPSLDTQPIAGLYAKLGGKADPHAIASAIMNLRDLAASGTKGEWNLQVAQEVMGMLDRLGVPYKPEAPVKANSPEEAFDALMKMPQEPSADVPAKPAPAAHPKMPPGRRANPRRSYLPR